RERKAPAEPDDNDDDGPPEPIDLTPGPVGRTEDPVRLYLREMGRVALLTREGEIALAKRIEEGKNQVTAAILSTNLALERFRARNIGNQIIDREDSDLSRRGLVQRLRDLLDDVERAEHVIRLWTNGRRPSADEVQNLIYVSFRDPGVNGGVAAGGDLHL